MVVISIPEEFGRIPPTCLASYLHHKNTTMLRNCFKRALKLLQNKKSWQVRIKIPKLFFKKIEYYQNDLSIKVASIPKFLNPIC